MLLLLLQCLHPRQPLLRGGSSTSITFMTRRTDSIAIAIAVIRSTDTSKLDTGKFSIGVRAVVGGGGGGSESELVHAKLGSLLELVGLLLQP